mmetsp:Transcript_69668/g.180727  ORF Transcript_69668/g.180727 Transcript_69668/m.180727 type:complete len:217 (-) Transcript_69668:4-654(-)
MLWCLCSWLLWAELLSWGVVARCLHEFCTSRADRRLRLHRCAQRRLSRPKGRAELRVRRCGGVLAALWLLRNRERAADGLRPGRPTLSGRLLHHDLCGRHQQLSPKLPDCRAWRLPARSQARWRVRALLWDAARVRVLPSVWSPVLGGFGANTCDAGVCRAESVRHAPRRRPCLQSAVRVALQPPRGKGCAGGARKPFARTASIGHVLRPAPGIRN